MKQCLYFSTILVQFILSHFDIFFSSIQDAQLQQSECKINMLPSISAFVKLLMGKRPRKHFPKFLMLLNKVFGLWFFCWFWGFFFIFVLFCFFFFFSFLVPSPSLLKTYFNKFLNKLWHHLPLVFGGNNFVVLKNRCYF